MKSKIYIFSVLIMVLSLSGMAQKDKADKLYAKALYYKAIPKYEKAVNTSDPQKKQESYLKLADCYRILNDYQKAEVSYKQALALGKVDPEVNYYYGNVLKSNRNYNEALTNYMIYLNAKPTDKKAAYAVNSCKEINYWKSKPQEYAVKLVEGINTAGSEFSPVIVNNNLIYTGEKQADYVEYATNGLNGQPYLNVLYVPLDKSDKPKSISKKINTDYHDGPVSFSADGTTMYLTRVSYLVNKRNKDFVNRAKLYTSVGKDKKWSKPLAFPYNSDDYSCAHASISADGSMLFFASDMPGGFGGKDIWMCKKNGNSWDKPVNLGSDINTGADEMFPYMRKDGKLYYSSNGLPGFGGLDIFSAKNINGIWILNRNESLSLNSNADDFGVIFTSDSSGYFSSNREGGKGKDDIYSFTYTSKYTLVDGTVLLTENINDPAKNVKVYLLNDKLAIIDSTRTDAKGYFVFNDLEVDKAYLAQVEDTDIALKNKPRYYMADKNQQIARVSRPQGKNKFVFRNLPVDVTALPELYTEDELTLAGTILFGENPAKPFSNKKITIRNEFGDVVEETTTSEFGAFAFRNLPFDQNYTLTVEDEELPENVRILLTNKSGKEVKVMRSKTKGKFDFTLLAVEKSVLSDLAVEDVELIMSLKGFIYDQDKNPIANAKLTVSDRDKVIRNIMTDEKGRFEVKSLAADKNYFFSFEDAGNQFKNVTKVYLADSKGKIYKILLRNSNGKFEYQLLEVDKTTLGDFSVDDPWLQVLNIKNKANKESITITENLTYAYGDYRIDGAGINILDKVISILKSNLDLSIELSSHTDSRSSDAYNLSLSQKRAKAAVDYIISKGIARNRLKAIGYGESHLLNRCKNGVDCTEEEHAINRRTEFKIVEGPKL